MAMQKLNCISGGLGVFVGVKLTMKNQVMNTKPKQIGFDANRCALVAAMLLLGLSTDTSMAQTNTPAWQRWLETAPVAPDFSIPATRADWEKQRLEVRATLWKLLGKLPPRPAVPTVKTQTREDRGDYVVEHFTFDNGAGSTVPGYLLLPKGVNGKAPAILFCHWHGGEYAIGKEELFQNRHTPAALGPTLARRGFVVLGIDACCFGERSGQGPSGPKEKGGSEEMTASKFNLWVGRTLWGMILRDDLMALDYLAARPEVDANRLAVTGISMGATRSWWLMALDERLKTGVAVACLTRYKDLVATEALPAHGIYYFVPGLLNHFDTEAVVSLIAPRPVLFMTGDQDGGSPPSGVKAIGQTLERVYKLYDSPTNVQNILYSGVGHDYTPEMWSRMLGWMEESLKAKK